MDINHLDMFSFSRIISCFRKHIVRTLYLKPKIKSIENLVI